MLSFAYSKYADPRGQPWLPPRHLFILIPPNVFILIPQNMFLISHLCISFLYWGEGKGFSACSCFYRCWGEPGKHDGSLSPVSTNGTCMSVSVTSSLSLMSEVITNDLTSTSLGYSTVHDLHGLLNFSSNFTWGNLGSHFFIFQQIKQWCFQVWWTFTSVGLSFWSYFCK